MLFDFALYPAMGTVAGLLAGLLGIGGGTLTVPLLVALKARPVRAVDTSAACGLVIASGRWA